MQPERNIKLKVCGMRQPENIRQVLQHIAPDYMGFIFYPKSSRYVGPEPLFTQVAFPAHTKKVGVFVKASAQQVVETAQQFGLDMAQLHGGESPETCQQVQQAGIPVIKVFSVEQHFDFAQLQPFESVAHYYLFDTKTTQYGGSGKTFNWGALQQYASTKPFFLSGGIETAHVSQLEALKALPLHALDVNSRFETAPALKNVELLKSLHYALKQVS